MIRNGLKKVLANSKGKRTSLIISIIYFFVYQWSINLLNFKLTNSYFAVQLLENWKSLLTKRSGMFLYEGIGTIELLKFIQLIISPINIFWGLLLTILVFINIASAIFIYQLPKSCRIDNKLSGLIGILPSFLAGFVCCVPSILIPFASILGSSISFFTAIFNWIFPFSIIILSYGAYKSLKVVSRINY